jgi:Leucine-rich repeat (LRR) protein
MDPEARLAVDEKSSETSESDWVLVHDGDLKGVTLVVDRNTGEAVTLTTRSCRDEDRWETVPDLSQNKSLEVLDLYNSRYLTDFDASVCHGPSLKRLLLTRCDNLRTVGPAIGILQNLVELNLYDSPLLTALPEEIGKLKNLKKLSFGGSVGTANKTLKTLPESIGQLENLQELVLDQCKVLVAVPETIGNLRKLTHLRLRGCKSITELPESIGNCTALIEVSFAKCFALKSIPDSIRKWSHLEDLNLSKCKALTEVPSAIGDCKKLCYLNLRSCVSLHTLPDSLGGMPRLRFLDLAMCDSLKMVPTFMATGNYGDSWRMEPMDLSRRVKAFRTKEEEQTN